MANKLINNAQKSKIFATLKSAGKDSEWLHDMLPEWTGKSSVRALSSDEANTVIKNLIASAAAPAVNFGFRTDKQFRKIMAMKSKLTFNNEQLNKFIFHTTQKKHSVDELSIAEASAVINGMNSILLLQQSQKFKVSKQA